MKIESAELIGWRNYEHQVFEFDGSPTILVGPNGQGKTNFVEAMVYAALGHSHRTASDGVLVRAGSADAIIRLTVRHNNRQLTVDLRVTSSGSNTVRVNGTATKRKELARLLPLVLFAPEDMDLVRGEPDYRRTLMNDIVSEWSVALAGDIAEYDRALRQRNSLLKSLRGVTSANHSTLDTWTETLIDRASRIMVARRQLVDEMGPAMATHYAAITSTTQRTSLTLSESVPAGTTNENIREELAHEFHAKRREEIDRGSTLVGPHRDDLIISLNEFPARTHSSQGEAWSCAIALRLAQVDVIRRHSVAGDPVVILDDVFSELDFGRRTRLGEHLAGIEHLIVTAADEASIPDTLGGRRHVVREGTIDA